MKTSDYGNLKYWEKYWSNEKNKGAMILSHLLLFFEDMQMKKGKIMEKVI